mgnify:CR=1 FL=1
MTIIYLEIKPYKLSNRELAKAYDTLKRQNKIIGDQINQNLKTNTQKAHYVKTNHRSQLHKNLSSESFFYFVHSYIAVTKNPSSTVGICDYLGTNIPSIISSGNVLGCQFHPEKSGKNGLEFLKSFCEMN